VGKGLDLNDIKCLSNEKGELNTTISPLLGKEFFIENFSIINLSFICNSGSIEPDGIYLGSAKNDLQEETKKTKKIKGPHSSNMFLIEDFIKSPKEYKISFYLR
tara:strand:+ start:152 stop:463 length:312 start_codon:yes stop_codon:yes gene_type:complete